jgi:hypothetical protein
VIPARRLAAFDLIGLALCAGSEAATAAQSSPLDTPAAAIATLRVTR